MKKSTIQLFKKSMSMFLVYLLILACFPIGSMFNKVKAAENSNYKKYDADNTFIGNKYNINGKILKAISYEDSNVILTNKGLYVLNKGQAKYHEIGKVCENTNIKRKENYIYLTSYNNKKYKLLAINMNDFKDCSEEPLEKYITLNQSDILQEAMVDNSDNKWFSVYQKDTKIYKLLRTNKEGKLEEVSQINCDSRFNYEAFKDITLDANNNLWFTFSRYDRAHDTNRYALGRITKSAAGFEKPQYFTYDEFIRQYKTDSKGNLWILFKDKLLSLDSSGKEQKQYKLTKGKSFDIDASGNVWVLDGKDVKKLSNENLVQMYTVALDAYSISVNADGKLSILGSKGINMINGSENEKICVDSHLRECPTVIKDNLDNTKIISQSLEGENIRGDLSFSWNITSVDKDGKFNTEVVYSDFYVFSRLARAYNNEIFIPNYKSIYKVNKSNSTLEKYCELFSVKNPELEYNARIIDMNIDSKGNIYAINNSDVYYVDTNKKVSSCNINKLVPKVDSVNASFEKLLKDGSGNIYAAVRVSGEKRYSYVQVYKLNSFDSINNMNYSLDKDTYPEGIFINEKNDIELVYFLDGRYKVYKVSSTGGYILDTRFENQSLEITDNYNEIKELKQASDGNLFLNINHGMYELSRIQGKIEPISVDKLPIYYSNAMVNDSKGGVYFSGSDENLGNVVYYTPSTNPPIEYNDYDKPQNSADVKKAWKVKFNAEINKDSVNSQNVFVKDSKAQPVEVKVSLGSDGKSILVTPVKQYTSGESYYIYISGIKSQKDNSAIKPIKIKFTISSKS